MKISLCSISFALPSLPPSLSFFEKTKGKNRSSKRSQKKAKKKTFTLDEFHEQPDEFLDQMAPPKPKTKPKGGAPPEKEDIQLDLLASCFPEIERDTLKDILSRNEANSDNFFSEVFDFIDGFPPFFFLLLFDCLDYFVSYCLIFLKVLFRWSLSQFLWKMDILRKLLSKENCKY